MLMHLNGRQAGYQELIHSGEACLSISMRTYPMLLNMDMCVKLWRLVWENIFQGQYKYWLALAC